MRRAILAPAILSALMIADAAASPLGQPRQLTFEGERAGEGYFSVDGRSMIFQSEREPGNPFYQMYKMDLETGDVDRLSPGHGKTTCGWLHPDGTRALYASTQEDPRAWAKMVAETAFRESGQTRRYAWDYDPTYDITEVDLETGAYTALAPAEGYDAEGAYSPDGTKIVFASNRHAYARDLSPEEADRLERDPSYFLDIYVMNADGTGLTRLTDVPGYDGGPFWSADGSRITWRRFSEDGARAEVFTMAADGTDERRITDLGVMSWAPFFHPSGAYIVFATNLQGFANFELYLVDAAGEREPVRVTDREGFDGLATFSPDGGTISWTSNATGTRKSQIFLADWDHEAALALLSDAPRRVAAAPLPDMGAMRAEIAVEDLRAHIEALSSEAMEGRLTGTAGEAAAVAYLTEAFSALGLEGAGDAGSFTQSFDFTAGVALGEGNALEIVAGGQSVSPALDTGWRPLAFSATGDAEADGVVFAGYGIVAPEAGDQPAHDSYAELDPSGKWVVLWRGLPSEVDAERRTYLSRFADLRYRSSVARMRGAAGVIFVPPPRVATARPLPRLRYEAGGGRAALPVIALGPEHAPLLTGALEAAAIDAIEAGRPGPMALPEARVAATISLRTERRTGHNVLARLDLDGLPAEEGRPPLMIGAHLDHLGRGETSGSLARADEAGQIHPGADDNASGLSVLLEVAHMLGARRESGRLDGARDVVFAAWSGEELGLLGASHYAEQVGGEAGLGEIVSAYINLDMVGRLEDSLVISGIGSSPVWAREIERRNAVVGLPITTSENPYQPTDATALYVAGVPVMSLFTGAHEDYHTPRDTADLINYEGLAEITRFVALVVRGLAIEADEPAYVAIDRPEARSGRRMGNVFLGTIPDYAGEDTVGVPISGVVKGGPAEAAGLEGGDVIVGLAGTQLANIYDYVSVLNGLKPGERVAIEVMRGDVRESFEIVPGQRE